VSYNQEQSQRVIEEALQTCKASKVLARRVDRARRSSRRSRADQESKYQAVVSRTNVQYLEMTLSTCILTRAKELKLRKCVH
jgi:hypothetical protein